jgi:DNA adenine methylase
VPADKLRNQRPLLKWAGNKYRIIDAILASLPQGKRLVEPFVGSAAVFFNARYERYLLSDSNADLINLYRLLKRHRGRFIDYARPLFDPNNNRAEVYYLLRDEFNQQHDDPQDPMRRAALFLYLNRHGYNGLCRYNAKGGYNVPFGQRNTVYFPEAEMRFFLGIAARASFQQQDFAHCMRHSKPGDVIYCDPPYLPLSATANFTAYHSNSFGLSQQTELAQLAKDCAARGIPVLISNHDTPLARELYADAQLQTLQVQRNISCKGDGRGKAGELLALFS